MHGLIFETSVWLLAESTRLISFVCLYDVWSLRACACMCGMCVYRQSTQHIQRTHKHTHTQKSNRQTVRKKLCTWSWNDMCQNCVKDREEEENMNVLSCSLSFDFLLSCWSKLTSMDILIDLGGFIGIGIGTPHKSHKDTTHVLVHSFPSSVHERRKWQSIGRLIDRLTDHSFPSWLLEQIELHLFIGTHNVTINQHYSCQRETT